MKGELGGGGGGWSTHGCTFEEDDPPPPHAPATEGGGGGCCEATGPSPHLCCVIRPTRHMRYWKVKLYRKYRTYTARIGHRSSSSNVHRSAFFKGLKQKNAFSTFAKWESLQNSRNFAGIFVTHYTPTRAHYFYCSMSFWHLFCKIVGKDVIFFRELYRGGHSIDKRNKCIIWPFLKKYRKIVALYYWIHQGPLLSKTVYQPNIIKLGKTFFKQKKAHLIRPWTGIVNQIDMMAQIKFKRPQRSFTIFFYSNTFQTLPTKRII